MASLYAALTDAANQIKHFDPNNPKKKNVLVHGPFWILQLWLNATFSEEIKPFRNRKVACPPSQSHIVWQHLLPLTPIDKGSPNPEVFRLLFTIMLTRVDFTPSMGPFYARQDGPEWFTRAFPLTREEDKKNSLILWRHYLTPQFLSTVIFGVNPGLVAYQPNLVARQFGLYQLVPKDRKRSCRERV